MQELLNIYAEIIKVASDEDIPLHLENLLKDASAITSAIRGVIDQARARASQPAQAAQPGQ